MQDSILLTNENSFFIMKKNEFLKHKKEESKVRKIKVSIWQSIIQAHEMQTTR